ncbi:phosphotransferase family protein [Amycolatopsis vancoresmycina]|uniref:Phosphotransferase n=1 Tax=Amycolatopsis vancoresmycina DSM 44592 TaxID=1292037 RepID=R1GEB5_9PSEU|nr:aminoglycoside phosphotransferase family protein [Amycolatopsis vancoresmycina]EOD69563.1 phosphotransferase [Amycolatopsis vancoresmycina DSM 44592]
MDGELTASGIDPASVVTTEDLGGGTYNRAVRVTLTDGRRLVLKIAPSAPGLAYEHDLLATEAEYYRLASGPLPAVVGAGPGFLLMTEVPGEPWNRTPGTGPHLRRELGAIVAGLHETTGDGFGYLQDPLHPTWPSAFTAMIDAILADAVRYRVRLPRPAAEIAHLVRRHEPLLELVTTPVLVHFDLWPGNILLQDGRVSGIIDAERAFWGDPVAEFVSLTLFHEPDAPLLAGYGTAGFDAPARRRLTLYRVYLGLIMLAEMVPRKDTNADRERFVSGWLAENLAALG